jgi:hypothetical protein
LPFRYRETMNHLMTLTLRNIHEAKKRRLVHICTVILTLHSPLPVECPLKGGRTTDWHYPRTRTSLSLWRPTLWQDPMLCSWTRCRTHTPYSHALAYMGCCNCSIISRFFFL